MQSKKTPDSFLPMSKEEMTRRGWNACDFIIVTGDAYIDHPAFGAAIIGRVLEAEGYRVGVISQPGWDSCTDFTSLGCPELAFLITSGNMDSMVAHYTASGKPRSEDAFTPGGKPGHRPDRAVITYTARARQAYKQVPVILGGIEASLRRLSHYDYWSDTVRRSILLDSKADLLIFGMGERIIRDLAARLKQGETIASIRDIPGTVYAANAETFDSPSPEFPDLKKKEGRGRWKYAVLPGYDAVSERIPASNTPTEKGKQTYTQSIALRLTHENPMHPTVLTERYGNRLVVQNPPAPPLDRDELDAVFDLPFTRLAHPSYRDSGTIPALQEIKFSITSNRGCFGGCSFCAITSHQGRIVQSRSNASILGEVKSLTTFSDFKGYIHDIGGPTANFHGPACGKQLVSGPCEHKQCLFPEACSQLVDTHAAYLNLLKQARAIPGVRKIFIRSGIRYDYLLESAPEKIRKAYIHELAAHHVSGQLRVAPEHTSPGVLAAMGKPGISLFERFSRDFMEESRKLGKKQYIIPYFISGHPGSTMEEAISLAEYLKKQAFVPDQVQDFYPTPGTISTCMYYTGLDPRPGMNFSPVYIPKGREKRQQRALLHFHKPENRKLVIEALKAAGRTDLIGNRPECLVSFGPGSGRGSRPGSGSSSRTGRKNGRDQDGKTAGSRRNKNSSGKSRKRTAPPLQNPPRQKPPRR